MAARPEDCLGNGGHSDYNRHRWLLFILARLDTWDVNQLEAAGEGGGLLQVWFRRMREYAAISGSGH
jgi:hypothetical protein